MQGHRVVKIFCREDFEQERFEKGNNELTKTFIRSERVRALAGPINEFMASLVVSGVVLYGGWSVISGTRTAGGFIAFLISVFHCSAGPRRRPADL
jgi:subfamily B ATP-binding cassette protein MsbA